MRFILGRLSLVKRYLNLLSIFEARKHVVAVTQPASLVGASANCGRKPRTHTFRQLSDLHFISSPFMIRETSYPCTNGTARRLLLCHQIVHFPKSRLDGRSFQQRVYFVIMVQSSTHSSCAATISLLSAWILQPVSAWPRMKGRLSQYATSAGLPNASASS